MNLGLPESVTPVFHSAGWYPGRRERVPGSVPKSHPAAAILNAFGGLTVIPDSKSGEDCATSDVSFHHVANAQIADVWSKLLNSTLIGVADFHSGHGELYVAADGRCFGASRIHDGFWLEGDSFSVAIESLLFGRRARPMLRPISQR